MNPTNEEMLAAAEAICRETGELLLPYFRDGVTIGRKGSNPRDLVTAADLAADKLIQARLRAAFPNHAIFSEESVAPGDVVSPDIPTWIIDPIDGTSNFTRGLPLFSISVALFHEGWGRVAVVHAPAVGWCFTASAGGGSALNGEPIQVSATERLDEAIVGNDWPRDPTLRRQAAAILGELGVRAHTLRAVGSAALGLAMVAAGWLTLYWHLTLEPWDVAGGALLIQEAGGRLTDLEGEAWRPVSGGIVASNGRLHEAGLALLSGER